MICVLDSQDFTKLKLEHKALRFPGKPPFELLSTKENPHTTKNPGGRSAGPGMS